MNYRTTIILAIVAAAAAVAVILLFRTGTPEKLETVTVRPFEGMKVEDIRRIELDRPGELGKIVVVESDGQWRMTEPVEARADRYEMLDLARRLVDLSYGQAVALNAANAAEFGFEPARAVIRFATADGKTHELTIGTQMRLGSELYSYVRLGDADKALLVEGRLGAVATSSVDEFRTKELVDVTGRTVVGLEVQRPAETLAARMENGQWMVTTPVQTKADGGTLSNLVESVKELEAVSFVPGKVTDVSKYGLDKPRMVVTLETESVKAVKEEAGSDTAVTDSSAAAEVVSGHVVVKVGGYADLQKTRSYVQVDGASWVAVVAESAVKTFEKSLYDVRDKSAVPVDPGTVTSLSLDVNGEKVSLTKKDDTWDIAEPKKALADSEVVGGLLSEIAGLKVKSFVDDADLADATYGLAKPYGRVAWREAGRATESVVTIGRNTKTDEMWVSEQGSKTVGRVDPADVTVLRRSWMDLHERVLWTVGPDQEISALGWTDSDETVSIQHVAGDEAGERVWKMTKPVEETLDKLTVSKLTDALRIVSARKFLAPVEQASEFGMDHPLLTLTVDITLAGSARDVKAEQHTLVIGKKNNQYVAMQKGGQLIFEVDPKLIEAIQKPLTIGAWLTLDRDKAGLLSVTGPEWALKFSRSDDEWVAVAADGFAANSLRVKWYLADLADAEVSRVLRYKTDSLAEWGLDKPQWRIQVEGLGFNREVLISARGEEGGKYATIAGTGKVVLLDEQQVSRLIKDKSYFSGGQ